MFKTIKISLIVISIKKIIAIITKSLEIKFKINSIYSKIFFFISLLTAYSLYLFCGAVVGKGE